MVMGSVAMDRWAGILFRGSALPGSVLTHLDLSNAGAGDDFSGCITVRNAVKAAVTLDTVALTACAGAALWVDAAGDRAGAKRTAGGQRDSAYPSPRRTSRT